MMLVEAMHIYGQSDRYHARITGGYGSLMQDLVMMTTTDLEMMKLDL